jgi:hypothetical protein
MMKVNMWRVQYGINAFIAVLWDRQRFSLAFIIHYVVCNHKETMIEVEDIRFDNSEVFSVQGSCLFRAI